MHTSEDWFGWDNGTRVQAVFLLSFVVLGIELGASALNPALLFHFFFIFETVSLNY